MSELANRICRVTAYRPQGGTPGGLIYTHPEFFEQQPNAIEITELAMKFEIEKTLASTANTCTLKIFNASEETRDDLAKKPLYVRIEAGYGDEYRHLFAGDLNRGYSLLKGVDWETTLLVGDGSRTMRYARMNRSYKRGTPALVAARDAAASMGLVLPLHLTEAPELLQQYATGMSLSGPARDELTRILARFGYSWSIQNGTLVVLKDEQVIDGNAIAVDPDNWLLGTPEWSTPDASGKPPSLKFETQLYPELDPGKLVSLASESITGHFKITKVKHTGYTEKDDWKSAVEAVAAL